MSNVLLRATAGAPPRRGLGVYFELGKFKIVELWLGFFVGASLLGVRVIHDGRAVSILGAILIAGVAVIAATCSLDDVQGVRDGVDQANHLAGARWGVSKPILTGRLDERRALSFIGVLGVVGATAYVFALVRAWPIPLWMVALITGIMIAALNYSYGLKLSYHGAGELVIFLGGAGTVLVPYGLVTGALTPQVLFNAALVGAWHAQVVMFSNTRDAEGDRATGRLTIAARTSPRGNRIYIATVFLIGWAATAWAITARVVPVGYALALAPVWALQSLQLGMGVVAGAWLRARLLGFRILRVGIVSLTVANLGWLS